MKQTSKNGIVVLSVVILFWSLLFSLSYKDVPVKFSIKVYELSKLDTILGDKLIEFDSNKIRKNNFESLLNLQIAELNKTSNIYTVKQLNKQFYLIQQIKNYELARKFSLLVKSDGKKIIDFRVFNDLIIQDIKREGDYWIVVLSDYMNRNPHWKTKYQFCVLKLDDAFNEIWSYSKDLDEPMSVSDLTLLKDEYTIKVNIVTGCEICFVTAKLHLSKKGEYLTIEPISNTNSIPLTKEALVQKFNNNGNLKPL